MGNLEFQCEFSSVSLCGNFDEVINILLGYAKQWLGNCLLYYEIHIVYRMAPNCIETPTFVSTTYLRPLNFGFINL